MVRLASLSCVALSACGPVSQPDAALERAVERLRSGALIEEMNQKAVAQDEKGTWGLYRDAENAYVEHDTPRTAANPDPCPEVGAPAASASLEVRKAELVKFGACVRRLLNRGFLLMQAFDSYKIFVPAPGTQSYAEMSDAELEELMKTSIGRHPLAFLGSSDPILLQLRTSYSMPEQDELRRMAGARRAAFNAGESAIYRVMERRLALLESFKEINRYAALLAMFKNRADVAGTETLSALAQVKGLEAFAPSSVSEFPADLLHPYAFLAIAPDENHEEDALSAGEDPFARANSMRYELDGAASRVENTMLGYMIFSLLDNPTMPEHAVPAAEAARVAVIDSGADWTQYPDLGLFLGRGVEGEMPSKDFSDRDSNPWIPAFGMLEHGSGVMATVLTIAAHYAPELLTQRKIDVGMWKESSVRSLLAGEPFRELHHFDLAGMFSLFAGIDERIQAARQGTGVSPDVVSMSLGFPTWSLIEKTGLRDMLLQAPWLWVMAAGNGGVNVSEEKRSCFDDVPAELRKDDHILCVGALEQGIVQDRIRGYSNFGARVDVYAYESYIRHCPNGTSCSTPAVTGAAAVLKASFPALTPALLKQAIVEAAEERELPVENETAERAQHTSYVPELRRVRVFDPETMLGRAMKVAQRLVRTAVPVTLIR